MSLTETSAPTEVVLTITPTALEKIQGLRAAEDHPDELGLRIEVVGSNGVEYAYDLSFEEITAVEHGDLVEYNEGFPVIIEASSVDKLRGATLDLPTHGGGGLVLRNPNRPGVGGRGGHMPELTGSIEDKVRTLLDYQINPSLAGHGGYAELVRVDTTEVYLRLGGGCQGCSMSAATVRQGIEAAIGQFIPEVTRVIDTTDHETGENPYYH
jgi:Fe/S biogenesis protein NfuA